MPHSPADGPGDGEPVVPTPADSPLVDPSTAEAAPDASTPAGILAAVTAVTFWGVGNTIIAGVPMPGIAIAFYRLLFAAVIYSGVLYASGGRLSRDSFRFGAFGGAAYGVDIMVFFVAIQLTTVANATTINALQPLVIMGFAAVMFGERIRRRHVLGALVATCGVAMVALGAARSGAGSTPGDLLAVAALFCWAWYFIASKKARSHLPTMEYMTVMNLAAFAVVAPIAVLTGDVADVGPIGWANAGWILLIVLVPGTGHILMNWTHGHTTLVLTSLVTLAMPVISTTSAIVLLDQQVNAVQVVGIAVVLAALAAVILADARTPAAATEAAASEPAP